MAVAERTFVPLECANWLMVTILVTLVGCTSDRSETLLDKPTNLPFGVKWEQRTPNLWSVLFVSETDVIFAGAAEPTEHGASPVVLRLRGMQSNEYIDFFIDFNNGLKYITDR